MSKSESPSPDPGGSPATGRDRVADLQARLAAAERRKRQLRQIIDLVPDLIFSSDAEGRYLLANKRLVMANSRVTRWAEHLAGQLEYGAPIETIIRRSADQGYFANSSDVGVADREAMGQRRLAYHRDAPSTHEQRFVNDRWALVSTRPTSDGGRMVAYTDITEQKAAERVRREKEYQDRELRIARDIQLSLLPGSKPRVPGFDIARWSRAADETGGDYFDWHTLDDGRIALAIGDVTGHGLGPAKIVVMCRAYFRASIVPERSLGAVLDHVNELLSTDLTGGRFVTAAVGLIDPRASHMQLFSAGQAPLFFFDAARNRVQAWGADHFPLGIVSAYAAGPPREIEFGAGDILVLVTDGFLEWPDRNGEHFDEQRLAATILELRGYSAEELTKALYERVLEFSGGTPQRDDLTAVVIKRDDGDGTAARVPSPRLPAP